MDTGAAYSNGVDLHQPRARKPVNSHLSRALNEELRVTPNPNHSGSGTVSERATPAPPEDAPPSVKATSAARQEIRRQRRMFPIVDYESRVSYFHPSSTYSNFRGFFVLFWVGLAIMVITAMLSNVKKTGNLLNVKQWPLFTQNIWELAAVDLLMCASTAINLPLHLMYKSSRGVLRWDKAGIVIQSIIQVAWLAFWTWWPFLREWSWTAQVFLVLHTLALFMKMHSWAFYNGHLLATLNRLNLLDLPLEPTTPLSAVFRYPAASSPDTGYMDAVELEDSVKLPPVLRLRDELARELTSPLGNVTYPANLSLANFIDYLFCPTLCYEIE